MLPNAEIVEPPTRFREQFGPCRRLRTFPFNRFGELRSFNEIWYWNPPKRLIGQAVDHD